MDLQGTYTFNAPPDKVWALLMDTTAIAGCMPGCRELRDLGQDKYQAELVIAVAAITGNYGATISIENKIPPESYRLTVQGTGRTGFVKGQADVKLTPAAEGTTVNVAASADVGGAVARVGQRLIEGVAKTMMNRFFACLASNLRT
jgi:carbon monoxide dehydrogenase subunit G